MKQYHADKRMFKCTICGRDYKWVDSLHKHMKIHAKVPDIQLKPPHEDEEEDEVDREGLMTPVYNYVTLTDEVDENDMTTATCGEKSISLVDLVACGGDDEAEEEFSRSPSSLSLNIVAPPLLN